MSKEKIFRKELFDVKEILYMINTRKNMIIDSKDFEKEQYKKLPFRIKWLLKKELKALYKLNNIEIKILEEDIL